MHDAALIIGSHAEALGAEAMSPGNTHYRLQYLLRGYTPDTPSNRYAVALSTGSHAEACGAEAMSPGNTDYRLQHLL